MGDGGREEYNDGVQSYQLNQWKLSEHGSTEQEYPKQPSGKALLITEYYTRSEGLGKHPDIYIRHGTEYVPP